MLKHTWRWSGSATGMRLAGEPREAERLTRGSEGGGWKSAGIHQIHGNSLAAYPTVVAPGDL
jgi:hypothetical protein